jgi:phosphoglycolate phosphatase-like HAD superfamily hydrolase
MLIRTRLQRPNTVILDCDGVLLDSNAMKIAAFRTALADYPKTAVAKFSEYQRRNFGRSRYVLFKEFFTFLGREPDDFEIGVLLENYAAIVCSAYLRVPLTPGCVESLERLAAFGPLYVASGSDQEELRWVMKQRGLAGHFAGIFGSPCNKTEILAHLGPDEGGRAWFIGDAKADFKAAQQYDWCDFIYMRQFSAAQQEMDDLAQQAGVPVIEALPELLAELPETA